MAIRDQPQTSARIQRLRGSGDERTADVGPITAAQRMKRWIANDGIEALRHASGDILPVELHRHLERRGEVCLSQGQRARIGLIKVHRCDLWALCQHLQRQVTPASTEIRHASFEVVGQCARQ